MSKEGPDLCPKNIFIVQKSMWPRNIFSSSGWFPYWKIALNVSPCCIYIRQIRWGDIMTMWLFTYYVSESRIQLENTYFGNRNLTVVHPKEIFRKNVIFPNRKLQYEDGHLSIWVLKRFQRSSFSFISSSKSVYYLHGFPK